MDAISLHDKERIYQHLKEDVYLHLYSIGDLDDFFWPFTVWFGLLDRDQLTEVALLYFGHSTPTLLALSTNDGQMRVLLEKIRPLLPPKMYAHLSPNLCEVFTESHLTIHHGKHYKMALCDLSSFKEHQTSQVRRILEPDLASVRHFYRTSYPDNWFDSRMLKTGQYFGIKSGGELLSIAGIHVYSPHYDVAALGNIATHPTQRNKGLATQVTAQLCRSLSQEVDHIGLNVKSDNQAAIHCYQKLGFEIIATYHEYTIQKS